MAEFFSLGLEASLVPFLIVRCEAFVGFADCFFRRVTGFVATTTGEGLEATKEQEETRAGI